MERTTGSFQDEPTGAGSLRPPAPAPREHGQPRSRSPTPSGGATPASRAVPWRCIAIGGVLTLMYVAKSVLILILVSVLIAFMLAPIVELCQRLRLPRSLGSMIAVLLMCAALYGVFYVSYSQADRVHVRASQVFRTDSHRAQPGAPARRARPPDHPERAAGGEGRKGYGHGSPVHQLAGRSDQRRARESPKSC